MGQQETIISFIRNTGPVLPAKIAKILSTDLLFASAHLSELVDNKKLKISNTKIGGSPVYYIEGQEARLQELYDNLNEKDQRAFDILKEKKVLKDDKLEPLMKVAIRSIKDFAIPLQVTYNNQKLLFWRWYLIGNGEAEGIIATYLKPEHEIKAEKAKVMGQKKEAKQKSTEQEKKRLEEEKTKLEEQKRLEQERQKIEEEKKRIIEERKKLEETRKIDQEKIENERKTLQEKQQKLEKQTIKTIQDEFFDQLSVFFKEKKIEIEKYEIIRKKSEIDFILKVPSVVGNLDYYCKAKNKKRISDGDLSAAFVQGQLKKLPVLMLVTGELTKKAQELLNTEFQKRLVVKKI